MVADNSTNQKAAATVVLNSLKNLGFKVLVPPGHTRHDVLEVLRHPEVEDQHLPRARAGLRTSPTRRRCSTRCSTGRTSSRADNSNWPLLDDRRSTRDGQGRDGRRRHAAPGVGRHRQGHHGARRPLIRGMWDKPYSFARRT